MGLQETILSFQPKPGKSVTEGLCSPAGVDFIYTSGKNFIGYDIWRIWATHGHWQTKSRKQVLQTWTTETHHKKLSAIEEGVGSTGVG